MYLKTPPKKSAKEYAIDLLSRRDHGQQELIQKMRLKGYTPEQCQTALTYCLEYDYLNDQRYALAQIRQQIAKGHGERRIWQHLLQKQVAKEIIQQALEELNPDWFALAKACAEKKGLLNADKNSDVEKDQKNHAKQVRFLQYRGFDFEQIHYALDFENKGFNGFS